MKQQFTQLDVMQQIPYGHLVSHAALYTTQQSLPSVLLWHANILQMVTPLPGFQRSPETKLPFVSKQHRAEAKEHTTLTLAAMSSPSGSRDPPETHSADKGRMWRTLSTRPFSHAQLGSRRVQ